MDVFGMYGDTNGEVMEHGWLTSETCIQFKISNNPIQFWRKRYKNMPVCIKNYKLILHPP